MLRPRKTNECGSKVVAILAKIASIWTAAVGCTAPVVLARGERPLSPRKLPAKIFRLYFPPVTHTGLSENREKIYRQEPVYVEIENEFGSLSRSDIDDFSDRNRTSLPSDYEDFLLDCNGGKPRREHRNVFVSGSDEPLSDIQYFYSLTTSGPSYSSLQNAIDVYDGRLPKSAIPVATDSLGNQYLLRTTGWGNRGSIWFWDHERESNSPSWADTLFVAKSLSVFWTLTGDWHLPGTPEWLVAVEKGDYESLSEMLRTGLNANAEYEGKSIIESAAIHARDDMIRLLFERGASLGDSLQYAEMNLQFFPQHESTVSLIRSLK